MPGLHAPLKREGKIAPPGAHYCFCFNLSLLNESYLEYQYTPVQSLFSAQLITVPVYTPLNLGLKQVQLLSVDEVSHSHLNSGEALGERIVTTRSHHLNLADESIITNFRSLRLNGVSVRMHIYHSLIQSPEN